LLEAVMRRRLALLLVLLAGGAVADASPAPGDGPEPPARHPIAVPAKRGAPPAPIDDGPALRLGARAGAGTLAGKTVYLSAGHGWNHAAGAWRTQRGNSHGLVEDFITVESVNQLLIEYLHDMGAYVVPIREADLGSHRVVVDENAAVIEGAIAAGAAEVGWGPPPEPLTGAENPFALGQAATMTASTAETGRVVFPVAVAASGYYHVYLAYVQGPDRAADAHVIVRHAGGESHLRVDQRRHGGTWMLLGRWYFDAGAAAARSSIAIANDSATPGAVVSYDAVRVGGGMAPHAVDGVTTGRPAYESCARYSTQLLGAPASVWDFTTDGGSNDVVARPRFAAWEHEAGEDAVYLAWHTNAPSPARGTMSIAYGNTYPCCSGLDDFAGTPGSLELLHAVHDELLADLRAGFDPAWRDAGKVTASLGELRPTHNPEMPAILVEVAFHDTAADAEALREPRFRRVAARAMAQGIARFFAARDGRALVLPPEPPLAVRVENAGPGALRVSWRPPAADPAGGDAPTGYRVHTSDHGHGFDDGVAVAGESIVLADLALGAVRYVRVTAENAGGRSSPSEVVGARVAASGTARILVVGGVDRLDRHQVVQDTAPLVGVVDRVWLDRMNSGTYAVRHATALATAGFAFDGASDEAVELGDVDLAAYRAVDWFVGEDSIDEDPLSAAARAALAEHVAGGGRVLISGAELVWALVDRGTPDQQAFARTVLRTRLVADDAATYDVAPLDGAFADVGPMTFRDDGPLGYDADFPDVLAPEPAAVTALSYQGGTGGAAAIAWHDAPSTARGVVLGFPLELVADDAARARLVAAAMRWLEVEPEPGPDPAPEPPAGCGCRTGGGGGGGALIALALVGWLRRRAVTRGRSP
jgi:MYXO-CTERM domain-containing protein